MRIISGILKGRMVQGFNVLGTRPTMDRVKESVFAIIQNKIQDSIVLDLFAGSGNLGIEAISNGCSKCYFNDINRECTKIIGNNIKTFNIEEKAVILNKDWTSCLEYLKDNDVKLDLIFLDPPYQMENLNEVIRKILEYNLLNKEGLIICEVSHNYLDNFNALEEIKNRKYGDKVVIIYENKFEFR